MVVGGTGADDGTAEQSDVGDTSRTGRRTNRLGRIFGSAPLFLSVVSIGLIVGAACYLLAPFGKLDSEHPDGRPSAAKIASAQDSLDSASMMFSLLNSALSSATGSIKTITSSADDIFDAIDTGRDAANTLSQGMSGAPNTRDAAASVNQTIGAVGSALNQAQGLVGVALQLDSLVTPLVDSLEKSKTPGSADALKQLKELQTASRGITKQLRSVSGLNDELTSVRRSLSNASANVDSAISQAQNSATQLAAGFTKLSSARKDTLDGATKITAGIDQLSGVMESIGNDIDTAKTSLYPPEDEAEDDHEVLGPADRLPWALLFGAAAAILVLLAAALVAARTRRFGNGGSALMAETGGDPDDGPTAASANDSDATPDAMSPDVPDVTDPDVENLKAEQADMSSLDSHLDGRHERADSSVWPK